MLSRTLNAFAAVNPDNIFDFAVVAVLVYVVAAKEQQEANG